MLPRRPRSSLLSPLAALALWSLAPLGCGHAPPAPDSPEAAIFYRARLAESPTGSRAVEYRDALETAEFAAAKRQGTVLAFRTFLSEFPDGPHQREARTLLESLRWNEASAKGTEPMLQGFLADEPQGAHSAEAWSRLAELQLAAAIKSADAEALRGWLAGHPNAAGRERAERALEEAEFREAIAASLPHRGEELRAFIAAHPDGVHRAQAEQLEADHAIEDAFILEDENELRAWAKSGNSAAKDRLAQLSLEQAAARLDRADLNDLVRDASAGAKEVARAQSILAELRHLGGARANKLVELAQALYLPRSAVGLRDLPQPPRERGRKLREAALALDGRAMPGLLAELSSPQDWVAVSALQSWLLLTRSLPPAEVRLRSARAAAALAPIAQDGPHLAALALAFRGAGDVGKSLATARAASGRDPRSLVTLRIAAMLEAESGDAELSFGALRALLNEIRASLADHSAPAAMHAPGAISGVAELESDSAPRLWSLCALATAAHEVEQSIDAIAAGGDREPPVDAGAVDRAARRTAWCAQAGKETRALEIDLSNALGRAEHAVHQERACGVEHRWLEDELEEQGAARAKAAVQLLGAGAPAAEALARAHARDPSPAVQKALAGRRDPGQEPAQADGLAPAVLAPTPAGAATIGR